MMTIISSFISLTALSSTVYVTTENDSVTGCLRYAINGAQNGDIIKFDTSLTTIKLGGQISFNKSITISGNPGLIIRIAKTAPYSFDRIFEINGTGAIIVNINNLKFGRVPIFIGNPVSYNTNGAIILVTNTNSVVNIDLCHFYPIHEGFGGWSNHGNNTNGTNGGGIASYGGVLNISNSTFEQLGATNCVSAYWGNGGAIFMDYGILNLVNCTFYKNAPVHNIDNGVGWGAAVCAATGTGTITNCTFCENYDSPIVQAGNSNLEIRNCIFYNNYSDDIRGIMSSGGYNIFEQASIEGSVPSDVVNCNPGYVLDNGAVVLSSGTFWIPVCELTDSTGCAIDGLPSGGNGSPEFDERGFVRYNTPDIGAYEYKGTIPLGIPELLNIALIRLYPNPVSDYLQIETAQNSIQISVKISNTQGRVVRILPAYGIKTTINVSDLQSGLYFVEVNTKNGTGVEKFVKQ